MSENTIDTIKIRKALEAVLDCISETRGKDATEAVANARSVLAEQQEKAPTSSCIGVTYVTQQSDGRFLVVDALAAPDAQPQESRQVRRSSKEDNPWHDAVLNACMAVESCYVADDPVKSINNLIDWYVQSERSKEASEAAVRDDVQAIIKEYETFKDNYKHDSLVQAMVSVLQSQQRA